MVDLENGDWRAIAEQASAETNPSKMMILVRQLCAELDREQNVTSATENVRSSGAAVTA
jgi:hypothetical protein